MESVTWGEVAALLAAPRNYWLSSVRTDGSPHATPVWGIVVKEEFFFYSARSTVKARNIASDPRILVHLESAEEVLIVRGTAEDVGYPGDFPAVTGALQQKYDSPDDQPYLPTGDPSYDVLYALRPTSARLWSLENFDDSQKSWAVVDD